MKRKNAIILAIVWLLVMVSIAASTLTLIVFDRDEANSRWVSRDEAGMIQRYERLEEIRRTLSENYYLDVDDDILLEGAIRGMMASLGDPYTYYYSPEEMQQHMQETKGSYQGIGTLVQNNADGYIEIIRVFTESPAEKAGLRPGDLLIRVDGTQVSGTNAASLNDAIALIKGVDGSKVKLTLRRDGETLEATVARGEVTASNTSHAMLENGVGYIDIFQFSGDAVEGFEAALEALQAQNAKGLIVDLRNNPGGILDDVVAIADRLLSGGTIVYVEDRAGGRRDYYSDEEYCDLPLVVLINDMSASASEILAAAIQDNGRGSIVGTQSYGKGVVQTVVSFESDGAGIQYTSACYFTPSGKNIHGTGVTPDHTVEADGYITHSGIPEPENDAQLRFAMDILTKEN